MANPLTTTHRAGYDQALMWAQQNLSAGVNCEVLVNSLIKQGWPEYDARQVLDTVLSSPTPPPLPATPPMVASSGAKPAVMNYASPRPANQQVYRNAIKDAHRKRMLVGAAVFGVGVVITVGSMAVASGGGGGTYLLCWGPIVFGGFRMVTGFVGWISN